MGDGLRRGVYERPRKETDADQRRRDERRNDRDGKDERVERGEPQADEKMFKTLSSQKTDCERSSGGSFFGPSYDNGHESYDS